MIPPIKLLPGKKIYFASDFHLGAPDERSSRERELRIVDWLNEVKVDAQAIFLMGDVFDFWFEYKYVIPKGFIRIQGALAQITDSGIPVYWFTGNHDMWIFSYFTKELGIPIFRQPVETTIGDHSFYLGHGDGLGPGDHVYKILKKIFANPFFQGWFRITPASIGMGIATRWSLKSRASGLKKEKYLGDDEWLYQYCLEEEKKHNRDFYIFGHRHLPLDIKLSSGSRYINLGEWVNYDTYAVYDGKKLELLSFRNRVDLNMK